DDAQHGQHAAHGAQQGGGDGVNNPTGAAFSNGLLQVGHGARLVEEGHGRCRPDQGDDALGDHGAVENLAPIGLVAEAASHQRTLSGMETADGAAGDGDEHQRPDGQPAGVQVLEGEFRNLVALDTQAAGDGNGDEQ